MIRPLSFISALLAASLSLLIGVYLDTTFYKSEPVTLSDIFHHPVITPLNNIIYNFDSKNLAEHGLHPRYQHILVNLPLLLGPAYLLLFSLRRFNLRLLSGVSGVILLSIFKHQEARFLTPAIPLILSSTQPPKRYFKAWVVTWIVFNAAFGILLGVYHQGGVVPTQNYLVGHDDFTEVLWWKTYSPPTWLLDGKNEHVKTAALMGMPLELMLAELTRATPCSGSGFNNSGGTYLIAPYSATFLDRYGPNTTQGPFQLERVWEYRKHLNLDDIDFAQDGIWSTLKRVVGRRGLITWKVTRHCS